MPAPLPGRFFLPLLILACSSRPVDDEDSAGAATTSTGTHSPGTTSSGSTPDDPTVAGMTSGMISGTGTTAVPEDSSGAPDSTTDSGCPFICYPDLPPSNDCDPYAQDCPEGQKCTTEGDGFNDTHCVPLVPDPKAAGEPCTLATEPPFGDDCEFGALCWEVDPATGMGTCHALCVGSPDAPVCDEPGKICWPFCQECYVQICIDTCDPLGDDCPEGQLCVSDSYGNFICVLDASGDEGQAGDPCEYINVCDPGLFCADSSVVPGCESIGCCAPYCHLDGPPCPGADEGVECIAWYEANQAPPGYENLGACVVP